MLYGNLGADLQTDPQTLPLSTEDKTPVPSQWIPDRFSAEEHGSPCQEAHKYLHHAVLAVCLPEIPC